LSCAELRDGFRRGCLICADDFGVAVKKSSKTWIWEFAAARGRGLVYVNGESRLTFLLTGVGEGISVMPSICSELSTAWVSC
jgi:hypothetical protein